jgi:hypothetical protein
MDDAQVGWITAIIIGGVAGWLAEQFMKSEHLRQRQLRMNWLQPNQRSTSE